MSVTLLQKGKVVIPKGTPDHERDRISNLQAIDYIMEWFTARIPSTIGGIPHIEPRGPQDRVLIIKAGTGSGKSTTIGPELYARFVGKGLGAGRSIGITQPRVLTAIDIPHKISHIPSMKFLRFGDNLGYQTGLFINKPIKGLIFMTIGIVSHQVTSMTSDEFMRKYSFVIFDECHERSLSLDTAMYKMKKFINANYKNAMCPFLILTSATFDTVKYAKYFDCGPENIIEVLGQTKPIAKKFPISSCSNMTTGALKKIIEIHEDNEYDYKSDYGRDIIVFVSVQSKIFDIIDGIQKYNDKLHDEGRTDFLVAIQLTSDTYKKQGTNFSNIYKDYNRISVFIGKDRKKHKKVKHVEEVTYTIVRPVRRVIISTPVAETGVTIDSLKYCIDTGLVMSPEWNPVYGVTVVAEKPVTQNMALQRKGRVGRSFPGEWHPLYTEEIFNSLIENTLPDIIIKCADELVLSVIIEHSLPAWDRTVLIPNSEMKSFNMCDMDLLDPIPYDSLLNTLQRFFTIGLITHEYKPTVLGLCAVKFSHVSMEAISMLMSGYVNNANILSLITIAAFLSNSSDKLLGRKYKRRQIFKDGSTDTRSMFKTRLFIGCDFIDYLLIYEELHNVVVNNLDKTPYATMVKWCDDNHINFNILKDIFAVRDNIIDTLISIGLNPYRNVPNEKKGSEISYSLTKHILSDFDGGIAEIKKIKQCILVGYKMHITTYNPIVKKYVNDCTGIYVDVQSDILTPLGFDESDGKQKQNKPMKIIYGRQTVRRIPKAPYKFTISVISILDGFVLIDDDLPIS